MALQAANYVGLGVAKPFESAEAEEVATAEITTVVGKEKL